MHLNVYWRECRTKFSPLEIEKKIDVKVCQGTGTKVLQSVKVYQFQTV